MSTPTWILLSGLGADHRMYNSMVDLLPKYQAIDYVDIPEKGEMIEAYALRVAQRIETSDNIVLCGVSFGGMLSSILCQHLEPRALVMFSSTHRPEALSHSARAFEWLSRVFPDTLATWLRQVGRGATPWVEALKPEQAAVFRAMVEDSPLEMIRRGGRMVMDWDVAPPINCPRFHLHGGRDVLMPAKAVDHTRLLPDAGHLLNLTHPKDVREFVRDVQHEINGQA